MGRTTKRNISNPYGLNYIWKIEITYIPADSGLIYLMCTKDGFAKELQSHHYSRSFLEGDAIRSVNNALNNGIQRNNTRRSVTQVSHVSPVYL